VTIDGGEKRVGAGGKEKSSKKMQRDFFQLSKNEKK